MNFKEWLSIDEARLKGFKRIFQKEFPDMPPYVQNDLYNTRAGHTLSQLTRNKEDIGKRYRTTDDYIPSNSVSRTFERSGLKGVVWSKKPINMLIKPTDFNRKTINTLLMRRFGFLEAPEIKMDLHRMAIQKRILQSKERNEPVIMLKTLGGLELLEGWHRTMNILLKGAPSDQIEILQNSRDLSGLDLNSWKTVSIDAYLGNSPEFSTELPGTVPSRI